MSAISFKSISGITSITTPAGADNQFTLHNNNTTEAVKLDIAGNLHINNQLVVAGVTTFSDDVVVNFGTGNDLQIYHTSSTNRSYIKEVGSGGFYLQAANLNVMNPAGNETMLRAIPDGAVELYHNNIKHFETTSIGCIIYDNDDTAALQFQNSAGLAGLIMGESTNIIGFKDSNPHWLIKCIKDGAVELYHDNSKKLETSSTGITVTGTVVSTGADINGDIDVDGHTNLDNVSIAGVTTITGTLGSGDITITSNQAKLSLTDSSNDPDWSVKNANGNFAINDETAGATRFSINSSNGVEFHMHAVPITDSTYDLGLTGTRFRAAYVDTYYGDGSNLTGIDATQIVTGNTSVQTVDTGSDGHVKITTEGGEKLRITSGGQVNIGGDLTQTTYPLSVLGSTGGNTNINIVQRLKYSGDSNQYNTGTVIAFTNTNTNADAYSYIGARIDSGSSGANANSLVFATNATNTAPTEKLRIDSSGKILSGHTAALTKFHGPASTTKRNPHIQVNGTNVNSASMSLTSWDNNVNGYYGPAIYLAKSGSSTIGTNSRVSNQLSILGSIIFSGDDGDEFVKGAMIQGAVDGGVTTGNNDMPGRLLFLTTKDGAQEPIERLRIDSTGAIMLMQDSNEGSAQQKLQWISNSGSLSAQAAWGQGSANFDFSVFRSDSQTDYPYGNFRVLTGGTSPSESLKVTVGGQVLKPRNPAFRAQGNTHYPNQTSGVDLVYNNEIFDKGSNYNPSNGRFTAPVSGTYFFYYCFLVYPDNDNYWKTLGFKINGSSSYANGFGRGQRGSQESQQISTYLDLNANDYVTPFVDISSGTLDFYMTGGHAHFFGYLVS